MKHDLMATMHRVRVRLVLPVRRLLRKLLLPLVVLPSLPLLTPLAREKFGQGPPTTVQLRLISVLCRPMPPAVLRQLGLLRAFHVLMGLVAVSMGLRLLRRLAATDGHDPSMAPLAPLVALSTGVYPPVKWAPMVALLVPRLAPLLVPPQSAFWPIIAVVLPARLVPLMHDSRLWLPRAGAVGKRPVMMKGPRLARR